MRFWMWPGVNSFLTCPGGTQPKMLNAKAHNMTNMSSFFITISLKDSDNTSDGSADARACNDDHFSDCFSTFSRTSREEKGISAGKSAAAAAALPDLEEASSQG